jgi:7,8-dihydropterin-6-yl-methyl-4-(beta-D-ribofuranosyl)aminobenzene 5'-phosphate synthase
MGMQLLARRGPGRVVFPAALALATTLAHGLPSAESKPIAKAEKGGRLVFTIVFDNNPYDARLGTAWGFACVVQGLAEAILFDTGGDGRLLLDNMAKCKIDPTAVTAVVLSHVHADHTGGLSGFLRANPKARVFMPRAFSQELKQTVRKAGAVLVETEGPCKICDRAWTTGVLNTGIPEQGLYVKAKQGLIVVTGCAHPGIVRMVEAAKQHAGLPVRAVLGGFHMGQAPRRGIADVIAALRRLGVGQIAPCHCSGQTTRQMMKEAFGEDYLPSGVGARLVFDAGRRE